MRSSLSFLCSLPKSGRFLPEASTLTNHSSECSTTSLLPTNPHNSRETTNEIASEVFHEPDEVLITSPPPFTSPQLLLEGDEFCVSTNGIARSYYELTIQPSTEERHRKSREPLELEELYDLTRAKKIFILRQGTCGVSPGQRRRIIDPLAERVAGGVKFIGPNLMQFDLQEIHKGVFGTAGTGAATWEASIAMSLFWSTHPEFLDGDVIELGSGVGLGGILSSIVGASYFESRLKSMTLTDHNRDVLEQCRQNVLNCERAAALPGQDRRTHCTVSHLDWYDFVNGKAKLGSHHNAHREKYDTVIASDCAYRYPDVAALASAVKGVLKRSESSRAHLFGPSNRGAFHDLIQLLNDDWMDLETEYIDISRYRLHPRKECNFTSPSLLMNRVHNDEQCLIASQHGAKFLHVTAWHKASKSSCSAAKATPLTEID